MNKENIIYRKIGRKYYSLKEITQSEYLALLTATGIISFFSGNTDYISNFKGVYLEEKYWEKTELGRREYIAKKYSNDTFFDLHNSPISSDGLLRRCLPYLPPYGDAILLNRDISNFLANRNEERDSVSVIELVENIKQLEKRNRELIQERDKEKEKAKMGFQLELRLRNIARILRPTNLSTKSCKLKLIQYEVEHANI